MKLNIKKTVVLEESMEKAQKIQKIFICKKIDILRTCS